MVRACVGKGKEDYRGMGLARDLLLCCCCRCSSLRWWLGWLLLRNGSSTHGSFSFLPFLPARPLIHVFFAFCVALVMWWTGPTF